VNTSTPEHLLLHFSLQADALERWLSQSGILKVGYNDHWEAPGIVDVIVSEMVKDTTSAIHSLLARP
jgi:hypothetical protein